MKNKYFFGFSKSAAPGLTATTAYSKYHYSQCHACSDITKAPIQSLKLGNHSDEPALGG